MGYVLVGALFVFGCAAVAFARHVMVNDENKVVDHRRADQRAGF